MATATKEDAKTKGEAGETVDPKTGEVNTTAGGAVAVQEDDDYAGYGEDAGAGFENQTSEDVGIPFITVLQPGSQDVQGEDAPAKAGMFKNGTTGDYLSGKAGLTFIPAWTRHVLVEWIPKDPKSGSGGGYVGEHEIDSPLAMRVRETQPLGVYKHPDQGESPNDLVETFYAYGLALNEDGTPYPAVLAFSSTFIKAYKGWMFRARSIVIALPDGRKLTKLPLFSHAYKVQTELVQKGGNSWYVPKIGFADTDAAKSRLAPSNELYQAAKSVMEGMKSGALHAATETLDRSAVDRTEAPPAKGSTDAKDAPY